MFDCHSSIYDSSGQKGISPCLAYSRFVNESSFLWRGYFVMSHNKYLFQITWAIYVMLVKGMNECKSYNFCFKQLTMNFIYIGSLASSIRSTATIKQFIRPSLYRWGVCVFGYGGTALLMWLHLYCVWRFTTSVLSWIYDRLELRRVWIGASIIVSG